MRAGTRKAQKAPLLSKLLICRWYLCIGLINSPLITVFVQRFSFLGISWLLHNMTIWDYFIALEGRGWKVATLHNMLHQCLPLYYKITLYNGTLYRAHEYWSVVTVMLSGRHTNQITWWLSVNYVRDTSKYL